MALCITGWIMIRSIITRCRENNDMLKEGSWETPEYPEESSEEKKKSTEERPKSTEKKPKGTEEKPKNREKRAKSSDKILEIISENPWISAELMAEKIGITPRAVEKHLSNLKAKGKLLRIGPNKGGHWEVR